MHRPTVSLCSVRRRSEDRFNDLQKKGQRRDYPVLLPSSYERRVRPLRSRKQVVCTHHPWVGEDKYHPGRGASTHERVRGRGTGTPVVPESWVPSTRGRVFHREGSTGRDVHSETPPPPTRFGLGVWTQAIIWPARLKNT